jgi:hypothetical protein
MCTWQNNAVRTKVMDIMTGITVQTLKEALALAHYTFLEARTCLSIPVIQWFE